MRIVVSALSQLRKTLSVPSFWSWVGGRPYLGVELVP